MSSPYGPSGGDPQWGQQQPGYGSGEQGQQPYGYGQHGPQHGQQHGQHGQHGQPYGPPQHGQYGQGPHTGSQPAYRPGGPHTGGQPAYGQPDPGQQYGGGQYGGYGQPNPYGQQPGQPGQHGQHGQPGQPWQQQYGGYGQQQTTKPPKKKSALPWILLVVGVLVIAGAVVGVLAATGALGKTTFDNTAVQNGVQQILSQDYGIQGVDGVSCPAGQEVKAGATFTCTATIEGQQREVPITVRNDDGEYEVGQPR